MAVSSYQPQLSVVYMGLAADTKPTNASPGARFIETDTLKLFLMLNTGVWTQVGLLAVTATPFPTPV